MLETRMGDPLLARSRRMPRGFQYRFLRPLARAGSVDAGLRLFPFKSRARREMSARRCATAGHAMFGMQ